MTRNRWQVENDAALETRFVDDYNGFQQHGYSMPSTHGRLAYKAARQYEQAMRAAPRKAAAEADKVTGATYGNLHPRRNRLAEVDAQGKAEIEAAFKHAVGERDLVKIALHDACLPRLPDRTREALAREELRMLLDGSPDPEAVLAQLAQGDGELAAMAVDRYAESYLRAKGIRPFDAKTIMHSVHLSAISAAANSADPTRRAASEAYQALHHLDGELIAARGLAEGELEDVIENAYAALEAEGVPE